MFRCGEKKFNWYVSRGLAVQVDSHTAKLTFEPKGNGNYGDNYLMGPKDNRCVVCGTDDALKLTRHHVVPHCYRKFFPPEYKNHNHFDILPVCRTCHDVYEHRFADQLKASLSEKYSAPLDGVTHSVRIEESKAVKYAITLLKPRAVKIPEARRREMLDLIVAVIRHEPSQQDLEELSQRLVNTTEIDDYHGQMVVSRLDDLFAFAMLWRQHFMDMMQPKFLPERWDIRRGLEKITP